MVPRPIIIASGAAVVLIIALILIVVVQPAPGPDATTLCRESGGYCASDCTLPGYTPRLGGELDLSCTGPETGGSTCCMPTLE